MPVARSLHGLRLLLHVTRFVAVTFPRVAHVWFARVLHFVTFYYAFTGYTARYLRLHTRWLTLPTLLRLVVGAFCRTFVVVLHLLLLHTPRYICAGLLVYTAAVARGLVVPHLFTTLRFALPTARTRYVGLPALARLFAVPRLPVTHVPVYVCLRWFVTTFYVGLFCTRVRYFTHPRPVTARCAVGYFALLLCCLLRFVTR